MDNAVKSISVIYFALILLGYINLYSYYWFFDIEIYNYISATEIALSFTSILFTILLVSSGRIIVMLYHITTDKEVNRFDEIKYDRKKLKSVFKILFNKKIRPKFKLKTKIILVIGLLCNTNIVLLGVSLFWLYKLFYGYYYDVQELLKINEFVLFISLLYMYIIIMDSAFKRIEKFVFYVTGKKNWKLSYSILNFLIIIVFTLFFNTIKYKKVITGNPLYGLEIEMQKGILKTDTNLVYIGSTNEYIFLRNLKEEKNVILKDDNIRIQYKKKLRKGML